jgi:hypothetical protein
MACGTLYQCFNFLARHNGRISFAPHPDDPCKTRAVIKVDGDEGEVLATVEYDCTAEMDIEAKLVVPVCRALQEQVEAE